MGAMEPRLVATILEVTDLDRSAALYERAFGLVVDRRDHEGGEHAIGDPWSSGAHVVTSWTNGAPLHFALYQCRHAPTRGTQVAFMVDDLAAAHRRALASGACVIHGPRTEPWGWSARYRDPDGNVVELTQHHPGVDEADVAARRAARSQRE
ncbi:VOC family protein [Actinomarinicola tropica]|uniref:VOC domain-containing protein n=1 Tax=Actinomarinicola tropica TaxID=2789776 RepID=A0A5Q2RQ75_9ACTN|nr:VOC family protein [Actinomarinicola tropica]QGG96050.1 hypothetical protein GH723_13605 [Actinomarinicola tropica]